MNFRKKVIYQIYPKSFCDSNNDGIGDLKGIISKLNYLSELGVDMLWINPFFISPQNDNGYDIADYKSIDPIFGTMEDFHLLIEECKKRNIGIMLDMVLNHSSTEHEWFKKALKGEKKYQDYYFIKEKKENDKLPTNWESKFGGSAWEKFGKTNKYYLHLYDVTQADLNWRNKDVREELYDVVNYWLDKGVSGFRFDVINVIGKDEVLLDSKNKVGKEMYTDKPIVHDFLKELNIRTFGKKENIITVGEMSSTTIENCIKYSSPKEKELTMTFNFHHLKVDYRNGDKWTDMPFDFKMLKGILNKWQEEIQVGEGWNATFWNNHDQPRALSRFCPNEKYRVEGAKMLATVIHLLRGTPYIYQGEEIGMLNPKFTNIYDYKDIETHNAYKKLKEMKLDDGKILEIIMAKSRDNSRTPMQWNNENNAGFSLVEPWIKVADNYRKINVEKELREGTIFNYYKQLIAYRKKLDIISDGYYRGIILEHPNVYGFIRELGNEKLIVLNNFYDCDTFVDIPNEELNCSYDYLIGNYEKRTIEKRLILRPYETAVFYGCKEGNE